MTDRGVREILRSSAAVSRALPGMVISCERAKFIPQLYQFLSIGVRKFFYGETCMDENRISRRRGVDKIGPYFRSYCSRNRKGTVFIKDLADRMGYCKTHGNSSFSGLLYSRKTEEIKKLCDPVVEKCASGV